MQLLQLPTLFFLLIAGMGIFSPPPVDAWTNIPTSARANRIIKKIQPSLQKELSDKGFQLGAPLFMRIMKMPGVIEVWLKKNSAYELFKTYHICSYSGYPGPKLFEGDWQSPEGFYTVSAQQLNPNSLYHLSFDVGFPNAFDRERKRTGSSIMVHGGCSSMGCFAMGDHNIEELYLLAQSALAAGQDHFSLHIFPFHMTPDNMSKFQSSPWISFWKNLQDGYMAFAKTHQVPGITINDGKYVVHKKIKLAMATKQ